MPTVLILSRSFPPVGSAGSSIRLVKFMKYIAQQGWNFIVLTQHPDHTVAPENRLSEHMIGEVPDGTITLQIPAPFVSYQSKPNSASNPDSLPSRQASLLGRILHFIAPETSLWWGLNVFRHEITQIKKHKVDLIFATTPTFVVALIGAWLSALTRKPLVLDMRDDWVGSSAHQQRNALYRLIERCIERWLINAATQVVLVTEQSYRAYKERYRNIRNPDKFHFIPNGCDLDEYHNLKSPVKTNANETFSILSAAWGYRKGYRDLTPFLLAFERFLRKQPLARDKTRIIFLGDALSPEYDPLIEKIGVRSIMIKKPAVNRTKLIEHLRGADLLFLVQPVGNTTSVSGTLYEYWASGKAPILLIAEEGASSQLVRDYNLGGCFHFDEVEQIATYIEKVFTAYLDQHPITIQSKGIEQFDRQALARKMEAIWRSCLPAKG